MSKKCCSVHALKLIALDGRDGVGVVKLPSSEAQPKG